MLDKKEKTENKKKEDKGLKQYLEVCRLRNKQYLSVFKEEVEGFNVKIHDLSKELMLTIRNKNDAEKQIEITENELNENDQKYKDEFTALKELECYSTIDLTKVDNGLAFEGMTKEVIIEHNDHKYKMGKYRIVIQNGSVRIYQDKNRRDTIHPHVQKGIPCLGDLTNSIPKLLANYEYVIVFDTIYTYLCSYNQDSTYSKIENWK